MAEQNFLDNSLYEMDNLDVLRGMNGETVDLIATDPPFNKKRNRAASAGRYEDAWRWADAPFFRKERPDQWLWQPVHRIWLDQIRDENQALFQVIESTRLTQDDDTAAFLCFLGVRLLEMHRVLKPAGSIYLHCDPAANGYIRMAMDAIFGAENFRNEIVWLRRQDRHNLARLQLGAAHDTIFWYAKSKSAKYNIQYTPYSDDYIKKAYNKFDERGQYRTLPCTNETGGNKPYEFRGITRAWRFSSDHMERLYQDGMLVQATPTSPFQYKKYLADADGVKIQDVWTDVSGTRGNERIGSPDQKPVALYERIIRASSNLGDLVLDPFAGCMTTIIAAKENGRRWVGIDRRPDAREHVVCRLMGITAGERDNMLRAGFITPEWLNGKLADYDAHYRNTPPERTDDGENAPYLGAVYNPRRKPASMPRAEMMQILIKQWGIRCWGCGFEPPVVDYLDLDHIHPASERGSNELENRAPLCGPCNRRKSNTMTLTALRRVNKREKRWYGTPDIDQRINLPMARDWAERYLAERARQSAF